ncbi:hypothetical protein TMU01_11270 [Tenuibacillus multivorans]|uniref:Uncharacterized protein n=2 Tax=Tenuibacillus multivorans TaxID=237069 RepID=A0A1G9ZXE5_9BACI|nr:hypothetical protein [Tenuibacillus multivorans]GEL76892.1 hypothetical protein TMU01_11270 [Tenuibacillus multivorans]SDN26109.1 hypothetical protein SAMN05216498_1884 [Tenuibacillus multivorans]
MKILVNGCFHRIAFDLIEHYLNEGNEIFGFDEVEEDDDKFNLYALIGRNALFHLNKQEKTHYDCAYDFTSKQLLCQFSKKNSQKVPIQLEDTFISGLHPAEEREEQAYEVHIQDIVHFLVNLNHCSLVPDYIRVNGKDEQSVHIISFLNI